MSIHQEQRLILCTALAISNGLVVGINGTATPLNLQNLTNAIAPNSGLPQTSPLCYEAIGFEFIWTGTATWSPTPQPRRASTQRQACA